MDNTTKRVPISSLTFDWQQTPDRKTRQHIEASDEWITYPLPEHVGRGRLQIRDLLTGMQVARCEIDFNPAMSGRIEQLSEISIAYGEQTLECHSLMSGRIYVEEKVTLNQYMYDTSVDFFRYSRGFNLNSRYDCSHSICATALMVGESVLFALIGAEEGRTLLEQLDLMPQPRAGTKSIPMVAKKTLHDAFANDIPNSMQSIYSQAKALEYLVLLKEFLASNATPLVTVAKAGIVRKLYDQLLNSGDDPPSLIELAKAYGLSAKSLNDLFRQEYRTSIFDFLLNQRMNSAYDAIVKTDEPLKQLARRLGYRHVTNFNTAFKRHFGRTPGSLRKS